MVSHRERHITNASSSFRGFASTPDAACSARRTHLSASHLIKEVADCLGEIPDHRPNHCQNGIPFGNFAKSTFAMMQMKMSSMLRFCITYTSLCVYSVGVAGKTSTNTYPSEENAGRILLVLGKQETISVSDKCCSAVWQLSGSVPVIFCEKGFLRSDPPPVSG